MTEKQKRYAEEIISWVKENLADDEKFGDVKYLEPNFSISLKSVPGYWYIKLPMEPEQLWNVGDATELLVDAWEDNSAQEDIDSFCRFIRAGEKYGWD